MMCLKLVVRLMRLVTLRRALTYHAIAIVELEGDANFAMFQFKVKPTILIIMCITSQVY